MVYQAGDMLLQKKQELFYGKVNEILVCQDLAAEEKPYYLLMVIKDHDVAKRFVEIYATANTEEKYLAALAWKEEFLVVFPYRAERPIEQFFSADIQTLAECEELCVNIVIECIASGIPMQILYLMLKQRQIHLNQDHSIYMGYRLDLSEFDIRIGEQECVEVCSQILYDLLGRVSTPKTISFNLLKRKNEHNVYKTFRELYTDLKATLMPMEKDTIFTRIKAAFRRNQDQIFRVLLIICVIAGVIAGICILTQIIWGDIPFFRLFINTFRHIGTESLGQ